MAAKADAKLKRHGTLSAISLRVTQLTASFIVIAQVLGIFDAKLSDLASCSKRGKTFKNSSRNLYRHVYVSERALPVKMAHVVTPVRPSRKRRGKRFVPYPCLPLSNWVDTLFQIEIGQRFLLSGHELHDEASFTAVNTVFWHRYKQNHPHLPLFHEEPEPDYGRCLPVLVHGDEGRGKVRRPVMVISYQMMVGPEGLRSCNSSQPFASQMLYGLSLQCDEFPTRKSKSLCDSPGTR